MAEQTHRSDPRILNTRNLERHHKRLIPFLRAGISVLDVGCGPGAITRGIAEVVGAEGRVVGVDRDPALIETARREHTGIDNLVFHVADATALPFDQRFDVVTAARTLQWVSDPDLAVTHLCKAVKPGGSVVVLDYNHALHMWQPDVPAEFRLFYDAFLAWRERNGWSNSIADHLADMFRDSGLQDVEVWNEEEVSERGAPQFEDNAMIWAYVAETLGPRMIEAGILTEIEAAAAGHSYRTYVQEKLQRHLLSMRTVAGKRSMRQSHGVREGRTP